jgi:hypothetical protein
VNRKQNKKLVVSGFLLFFAGVISVINGLWFVIGDHPFHREGGYSREFGMTEAQLNAINPQIADWGRHVSDQVGSVSFGWGMFIVVLAVLGILRAQKTAWVTLWLAGTPTLIYSTFGEFLHFGTFDEGSLYSMIVLVLFVTGMIIPSKIFFKQEKKSVRKTLSHIHRPKENIIDSNN